MMDVIITKPGKAGFEKFEQLPGLIYPDGIRGSQIFSQINSEFLYQCIVMVDQDTPVARLSIYDNPNLKFKDKKSICIGNYECIEDANVSTKLLNIAIQLSVECGAEYVIGPMNGSTWDAYRFSTDHDHPNFLLEPFHPLYYNDQFLRNGFESIAHYHSSKITDIYLDQDKFAQLESVLTQEGIAIRSIDIDKFEGEIDRLFLFLSENIRDNYLFTPINHTTFRRKYIKIKPMINPDLCLIAEDNRGEMAGFIFCYEDLLNHNEKSLIVKTVVRDKSDKFKGLGQYLGGHILKLASEGGFESLVHAFMLSGAASSKISKSMSGRAYKNYVLYGKEI